jgi:hypothetical protein
MNREKLSALSNTWQPAECRPAAYVFPFGFISACFFGLPFARGRNLCP